MIGLKKRDIKKALKAGAKAGGVSLADIRADIEATIDEAMNTLVGCDLFCRREELFCKNSIGVVFLKRPGYT